jgi:ABC-type amino acid transport substrate-binding protein
MHQRKFVLWTLAAVLLLAAACADAAEPEAPVQAVADEPAAAPADESQASGEISLSDYFTEAQTVEFYPRPWPLNNLVNPGTLTVGITAQTPPGSFTDPETGEFAGSRIELWRKLADDLELEIEFVRLDWPGILPGLAANQFDMACEGAGWREERLGSDEFLMSRPISVGATVFVVRNDSGIESSADITGKILGGVKGQADFESGKAAVENPSEIVELSGKPEAILALLNGQMDAFATDLISGQFLIKESPRGDELIIIGPPANLVLEGMCVNIREPDLLQAVNVLLTNYKVDGTYAALEREFYGSDEHVELLSVFGY